MGKRARLARERARTEGVVFRDGKLVNAEEWRKSHSSATELHEIEKADVNKLFSMRRPAQQAVVVEPEHEQDEQAEPEQVLAQEQTQSSEFAARPYFCTHCNRMHKTGKVFIDHQQYAKKEEV